MRLRQAALTAATVAAMAAAAAPLIGPPPTIRPYRAYMPAAGVLHAHQAPPARPPAGFSPSRPVGAPVGFAAGVTGGAGGPVTMTDDAATMRAALAAPGRGVVVGYGEHRLSEPLTISSDKTLLGRGLRLVGGEAIDISRAGNVIVQNVTVGDCLEDAVSVGRSSDVWLDGIEAWGCHDGLIDIVHGSARVTLSNAYLHDHRKAVLVTEADSPLHGAADSVTLWRVRMERVEGRHPKLRLGYVHAANVLHDGWGGSAIDVAVGGRLYLEANVFRPSGKARLALQLRWEDRPPGFASAGLSSDWGGAPHELLASSQPVPPPPYDRSWVRPLSPSTLAWMQGAGPEN